MSDAIIPALAEWADWDWNALRLDWSIRSVYLVCAVVGGAILLIQTALLLFGWYGFEDVLAWVLLAGAAVVAFMGARSIEA